MQLLVDKVQSTGENELEKVSLERLADINPDLLQQIKEATMEEQKQQQQNLMMLSSTSGPLTMPAAPVPPLSNWVRQNLNHLKKLHNLIALLQCHIRFIRSSTLSLTTLILCQFVLKYMI